MKRLVFINPNHRKFSGKVVDGGFSRNCAWEKWLKRNCHSLKDVRLKEGKIVHLLQTYFSLLMRRKDTIFFLYPRIGTPLFQRDRMSVLCNRVFFGCLRFALKRNNVVFDISDLKYEQSIDLELVSKEVQARLGEAEELLFTTGADYIFASFQMRDYVCKKYKVAIDKTDVCINGGLPLKVVKNPIVVNNERINYVYAGTLNKGRQIEQLLSSFPENDAVHLYLLGTNGEWIDTLQSNITYLGALEETNAQSFVSTCDVGLIPYDNERLYYNIAYPTKLSFYITAGIPYLSTPVKEVERENNIIDGGWLYPMAEWRSQFSRISKSEIEVKKKNVKKNMSNYLWTTILDHNKFVK